MECERKTDQRSELLKPNRIIGVVLILAGVVCFWAESADKAQSDWKIDVLGIALVLFGMWVGKFSFKKNQGTPHPGAE